MFSRKEFIVPAFILWILASDVFTQSSPPQVTSQPKPPSMALYKPSIFYVYEGDFSVDLPTPFLDSAATPITLETSRGLGTGRTLFWKSQSISYQAQFIDLKDFIASENSQIIKTSIKNIIANAEYKNGEFQNETGFRLLGISGKDLTIKFADKTDNYRIFLIKHRLYVLIASVGDKEKSHFVEKYFNSFKQIDGKSLLSKVIEEAEPKSLPQSPAIPKLKSDAEDFRLKGEVKTLIQEVEVKNILIDGRLREFEHAYDKSGFLVKKISFGITNLPILITVYGYFDNKRVSKLSGVAYQIYQKEQKESPLDYHHYVYDTSGRLIEETNGDFRTTYSYDQNTVIKIFYYQGKHGQKTIIKYDENWNEIEAKTVHEQTGKPFIKTSYKYLSFDEKGNWTKRTSVLEINNVDNPAVSTQYRTITYYD